MAWPGGNRCVGSIAGRTRARYGRRRRAPGIGVCSALRSDCGATCERSGSTRMGAAAGTVNKPDETWDLIVATCGNFRDFPTGGTTTMVRGLLSAFPESVRKTTLLV